MVLKIEKIENGSSGDAQESRYYIVIAHAGHTAELEVSPEQIIRRFPELIDEISLKQSIANAERQKSGLAMPFPASGRG